MLSDRFGLPMTTTSAAARDFCVEGCDLMFALWPGAEEAFARATGEDPNFALAHLGLAQVALLQGNVTATKTALAAAQAATAVLSKREVSQLNFFALFVSGQARAAQVAARTHLGEWPRDAVVMNHYGTISGLISASGAPGAKREQELVMDAFAPHYGDDWWFTAHHAMAISEMGRGDEARSLAERSLAANRQNAWAAHSRGHVAYEAGDTDEARTFLSGWLVDYPREGALHGHISWHLAISELAAGDEAAALKVFNDTLAPGVHLGSPRFQIVDAAQFLWRWEMAGNPRDVARWQALDTLAHALLPNAATHFGDWHIALADAVAGDSVALEARIEEMEALVRAGRYPEGAIVPTVTRGLAAFARADYAGAIATLSPFLDERERLGGSRAQTDLIELTVLRACVESGRLDELKHRLSTRRLQCARMPVAGAH